MCPEDILQSLSCISETAFSPSCSRLICISTPILCRDTFVVFITLYHQCGSSKATHSMFANSENIIDDFKGVQSRLVTHFSDMINTSLYQSNN